MTPIERAEAEELRKMEIKIEEMKIKLLELKTKLEQTGPTENNESIGKKREIVFRGDQENAIKNNLGQMCVLLLCNENILIRYAVKDLFFFLFHRAKDIKELVTEVKKLEEEVSI